MKPRSDTVPAWPFASACVGLLILVAVPPREVRRPQVLPVPVSELTDRLGLPRCKEAHVLSAPLFRDSGWSRPLWGEETEQLQLALSLHPNSGALNAWLRNGSANAVTFSTWGFGLEVTALVEIWREGRWTKLPLNEPLRWATSGIGPHPGLLRTLAPGGQYLRTEVQGRHQQQAPSATFEASSAVSQRQDLGHSEGVPTVSTSLKYFEWPNDLSGTNRVTIRIAQQVLVQSASGLRAVWVPSASLDIDPTPLVAMTEARRQL